MKDAKNAETITTTTTGTTNTTTTPAVPADPFAGLTVASATSGNPRKLAWTDALQTKARELARTLIARGSAQPELREFGQAMLDDACPATLILFITQAVQSSEMVDLVATLTGCPSGDLDRMLESQRSNRSKAKRAGLRVMSNLVTYVASMLGELAIRSVTGKKYSVSGTKLETRHDKLKADATALNKRINSLASKRSRLVKLAPYEARYQEELDEVEKELAELRALRPKKRAETVQSDATLDVKAALEAALKDGALDKTALDAVKTALEAVKASKKADATDEEENDEVASA